MKFTNDRRKNLHNRLASYMYDLIAMVTAFGHLQKTRNECEKALNTEAFKEVPNNQKVKELRTDLSKVVEMLKKQRHEYHNYYQSLKAKERRKIRKYSQAQLPRS